MIYASPRRDFCLKCLTRTTCRTSSLLCLNYHEVNEEAVKADFRSTKLGNMSGANTKTTNFDSLPTEIVNSIFQLLFVEFDLHHDKSIFNAMRVCRSWRRVGTGLGFISDDGKVWKFADEFCELRRVLEYDDRDVQWDPRFEHEK